MSKSHIIIIAIMLGAGLLAGSANFLLTHDPKLTRKENWIKFFSLFFLSTCATITVPLFLQILSNNLLDELGFKNALIFGGFCILAGFFSKRYLDDLYSKVQNLEQKVDKQGVQTKNELKQSAKEIEDINKKTEDLEESIEEIDSDNIPTEIKETLLSKSDVALTEPEIEKFISAFLSTKYKLRTIKGISEDTNIEVVKLKVIMEHLQNDGFVENKVSSNGKTYWKLLKFPLRIYSANYGIPGYFTNVTKQIIELIAKGEYQGIASQSFFNIIDPAPGIVKMLKIHYRIHGKEKELNVNEGDTFRIE